MTISTTTLDTTALTIGMVVHCHGSRFLITDCHYDEAKAADRVAYYTRHRREHETDAGHAEMIERELYCRAFTTEYLGPVCEGCIESIPKGWLPWVVQGNRRAFWAVETDSL